MACSEVESSADVACNRSLRADVGTTVPASSNNKMADFRISALAIAILSILLMVADPTRRESLTLTLLASRKLFSFGAHLCFESPRGVGFDVDTSYNDTHCGSDSMNSKMLAS